MSEHVVETIDAALDDWQVSNDAMRWAPDAEPTPPSIERFANVTVTIDLEPFRRAMEQMGRSLAAMLPTIRAAMARIGKDAHPAAPRRNGPPPLCIDGHAYNRRRKARRGKR